MGKHDAPKPSPHDRLLKRPQRTASVTLALDPNDAERLAAARLAKRRADAALDRAEAAAAKDPTKAHAVDQANEAAETATATLTNLEAEIVTFTIHLHPVGVRRVEELMLEHKPTDQQRRKAKQLANGDPKAQPTWNEDTFPPAFLAESIDRIEFSDGEVIEDLSIDYLAQLWNRGWTSQDRELVLGHALHVNQASSAVGDLGKG